jgi:hypothetical protein
LRPNVQVGAADCVVATVTPEVINAHHADTVGVSAMPVFEVSVRLRSEPNRGAPIA